MPGCPTTLLGLAYDCAPSMGGIKTVYMIPWDQVTAQPTIATGEIATIPLSTEPVGAWKQYYVNEETAFYAGAWTITPATNNKYNVPLITLSFPHMDTLKRTEMEALVNGAVRLVYVDNNGKYWYLGFDNPVRIITMGDASGIAAADANAYTIGLGCNEKQLPYVLSEAAVTALLATLTPPV